MNTPTVARPGRNDLCPCGSGRKYKQCCLDKDESASREAYAKAIAEAPESSPDTAVTSKRTPKHQTQQPWKTATKSGFTQRVRTPRKVGGG